MPRYFNQTKYKSFQRQCNIYGFQRIHHGPHKGGYAHKYFLQDMPDLCSEIKRETTPVSQSTSPVQAPVRTHRRGQSLDFRSSAPAAFIPPPPLDLGSGAQKPQHRHRRVVSFDSRQKGQQEKPFDFSLIAGEGLGDFNPSSPLRDDPLNIESMGPLEPVHPFHRAPIAPPSHKVHSMEHLKDVTPPTPTLPLLDELRDPPLAPSLALSSDASMEPHAKDLATPLERNGMDKDDMNFFKDLFNSDELEGEKELLNSFDVVSHPMPPATSASSVFPPVPDNRDFTSAESSSVVDELMCFAENVSVGEYDSFIAPPPLPSVPEPMAFTPIQPLAATISPLASGAVNEHNFPRKLYRLLEDCETNPQYRGIVAWSDDGTAFSVLSKKQFVELILPNYFDQTQYASFRRQLNMYSFVRQGNTSTYSNPYFIKGRRDLLDLIQRKSVNPSKKD
ncbi:MAG: hypothetical protein SGILL_007582 [Bacillariaceae sp.]